MKFKKKIPKYIFFKLKLFFWLKYFLIYFINFFNQKKNVVMMEIVYLFFSFIRFLYYSI